MNKTLSEFMQTFIDTTKIIKTSFAIGVSCLFGDSEDSGSIQYNKTITKEEIEMMNQMKF
jgi:hypothetical protein